MFKFNVHSGWQALKISICRLERMKMYDKSTRNRNLLKRLIDIVMVLIGVTIADLISGKFFNGSLGMQIVLIIIFMAIMVPIDLYIEKKLDGNTKEDS